jgi:tRNA pseudouridine65 synthase
MLNTDSDGLALEILHQDEQLAVVNKPAGLMVHDSKLARGERDFAADRLREQFGKPIHLIHRLDRATSGCLLLAFDRDTAALLGRQFMSREVRKLYWAVCRGWPADTEFVIEHPLDGGPGKPDKKPATTHVRVLAKGELDEPAAGFPTSRYAWLECAPETGRFRQIRRHLKHIDHHLIGDTSHGDGRRNLAFRMRGIHRMLLHARALSFAHPVDASPLRIEAPLDAAFKRALQLFRWQQDNRVYIAS